MLRKKRKLVTHDGSFHADDLFACATLCLYLRKHKMSCEIIRSREDSVIKKGDYVFDVGGIYDPEINRYDHHQKGGAGERENGIPYSSFGLIWKHFGMDLCDYDKEAWELLDKKLVSPIDAIDNGVDVATPKYKDIPINLDVEYRLYSPTWKEPKADINKIFKQQVRRAKTRMEREIKVAKDEAEGRKIIRNSYIASKDKSIIILDVAFPRYMYQHTLSEFKEPVYVIVPQTHGKNWKIEAISKGPNTMQNRKLFPKKWRGYMGNDPKLSDIVGIQDIIFTHQGGFLVNVKSKESAIKLAKLALDYKE